MNAEIKEAIAFIFSQSRQEVTLEAELRIVSQNRWRNYGYYLYGKLGPHRSLRGADDGISQTQQEIHLDHIRRESVVDHKRPLRDPFARDTIGRWIILPFAFQVSQLHIAAKEPQLIEHRQERIFTRKYDVISVYEKWHLWWAWKHTPQILPMRGSSLSDRWKCLK